MVCGKLKSGPDTLGGGVVGQTLSALLGPRKEMWRPTYTVEKNLGETTLYVIPQASPRGGVERAKLAARPAKEGKPKRRHGKDTNNVGELEPFKNAPEKKYVRGEKRGRPRDDWAQEEAAFLTRVEKERRLLLFFKRIVPARGITLQGSRRKN